jgi:hypothetical protein
MRRFRPRGFENPLPGCYHVCFWVVLMPLVLSWCLFDVLVLLILQLVLVCKYSGNVCFTCNGILMFGLVDIVLPVLQLVFVCKYCSNVYILLYCIIYYIYIGMLLVLVIILVLYLLLECK